jgi:Fe-S-cluster containining protein
MAKRFIIYDINSLKTAAENTKSSSEKLFKSIDKKVPAGFDNLVHNLHEEIFKSINCLSCGNCCKVLGPRIINQDVDRLSKYLKIKQNSFIDKYLKIDEDNDFVFKKMPCPFIDSENYCKVYSVRPKACREYPHTNRRKFHQLLNITLKNTFICPAVYAIVEELKRKGNL